MTTGYLESLVTEFQRNLDNDCSSSITSDYWTACSDSCLRPHSAPSIYSDTVSASYRATCIHFSTINDDRDDGGLSFSPRSEFSALDASEGYEDVSKDDIVIAVMGFTGTGKSTFINVATGNESVRIGHTLRSCTTEVQTIRCRDPQNQEQDVVFVDTPGFDNTYMDDIDILKTIATWLGNTYRRGVTLSGILFLHHIIDDQISRTLLHKLMIMFQQLCGNKALKNVIFVTTQWDLVLYPEEGIRREKNLCQNYWNPFIKNGSQVRRFQYTHASAWDIINATRRASLALTIQEELVDKGIPLAKTSAGRILFLQLNAMAKILMEENKMLELLLKEISTSDNNHLQNSLEEALLVNKSNLNLFTNQIQQSPRRKYNWKEFIFSRLSSIYSSISPHYIPVQHGTGSATFPVVSNPTTPVVESDFSTDDLASFPGVNVPEVALNDREPTRKSQSNALTYTLQTLRFIKATTAGLSVPGLQSVVSVTLQITELLINARDTHDSLVNLMKDASQLIEIITQDVRCMQEIYPLNIISAIDNFTLELNKIIDIAKKIKAAERNVVTRYILQPEDQRAIANCNDAMKFSLQRLQIKLGLVAVAQNEASRNDSERLERNIEGLRKDLERLEKNIERLNTPPQCDCHLRCAVRTQAILNSVSDIQ